VDGVSWTQRAIAARCLVARLHDALRDQAVPSAARTRHRVRDTWVWNGASWTLAATARPPGGHGMVRRHRGRVVLSAATAGRRVHGKMTWDSSGPKSR
jgi:hypothetical protein